MVDKNKEYYKKLGLNIAYYRKYKRISQMKLAEEAGISRVHVSRLENGDCAISFDVFLAICEALDVPPNEMMTFR